MLRTMEEMEQILANCPYDASSLSGKESIHITALNDLPQNKPLTQFWGERFGNGPTEHLINQRKDKSLLGILLDCNQATEQLTYMIGAMEEQATDLQGYSSQIIPAATWWSKFLVIFNLS